MDKNVGIYQITNKVNNKFYIGSSKNLKKRESEHRRANRNTIIHKAIRKYGVDNFKFELLENCNECNLIEREQYYYDKLNPPYNAIRPIENPMDNEDIKKKHLRVMNSTDLKEIFRNKSTEMWANKTESERAQILNSSHTSEANEKRIETMNTEEFRNRHSVAMKRVWEDEKYREKYTPIKTKILKEIQSRPDVRQKYSYNSKKRWENKQYRDYIISQTVALSRKMVYLNDGLMIHEFESICECARWVSSEKNINEVVARTTVSAYLNGRLKSAFGYGISFNKDVKPFVKQKRVMVNRTKVHDKVVVMLCEEMEFIRKFDTVKDAGDYVGIGSENISRVCKGKNKTAGGYKWMYYEDYIKLNNDKQLSIS